MKIRHGRMGTTRSGACGVIWLNTWNLPRMWHRDWQIDSSLSWFSGSRGAWPFLVGGVTCLVDLVSVCAVKEREREDEREERREKREKRRRKREKEKETCKRRDKTREEKRREKRRKEKRREEEMKKKKIMKKQTEKQNNHIQEKAKLA